MRSLGTLAAAGVTKAHGAHVVLADVDLVVPPHARIGLVGPNGAGKSTLLRLLAGLDAADSGTIRRNPAALDSYLERGGGDLEARAGVVLGELGLGVELDRPRLRLSGGEAARAALASVLLSRFDVLLLDEPTNDLDFDGLARLETFLAGFEGSAVIVSHDRAFLDRTVTRIVELDEWTHGAREFAGGWSEYEAERARRLARHYERWEGFVSERDRIEEQARRMQRWEERGYGQGRKKKKSKDVKKAYAKKLDRLEGVEKPYEPWELRLGLAAAARSGDVVVRLEHAVVERGTFRLGPVDLEVSWGERLALTGPNGSGKTTLLDAVLGRLPLAAGTRWAGPGVVLGEVAQQRNELAEGPLLQTFTKAAGVNEEAARTLLAKFGLGADHVLRDAGSL